MLLHFLDPAKRVYGEAHRCYFSMIIPKIFSTLTCQLFSDFIKKYSNSNPELLCKYKLARRKHPMTEPNKSIIRLNQSLQTSVHFCQSELANNMILSIYCINILLNLLCTIVFSKILLETTYIGNMFKYYLAKSICDFLIYSIFATKQIIPMISDPYSYIYTVWRYWFSNYFLYVLGLCSVFFELMSTFDCYLTAKQILQLCLTRWSFFIVTSIVSAFTVTLKSYKLYSYQITGTVNGSDHVQYNLIITSFGRTEAITILEASEIMIRDVTVFLISIILNILILSFLNNHIARRRNMQGNNTRPSPLVASAEKAQRNKLIMIISISVNHLLGRFLFVIMNLPLHLDTEPFWPCFSYSALFLFHVSNISLFFSYLFFNKSFKRHTMMCFCIFKRNDRNGVQN